MRPYSTIANTAEDPAFFELEEKKSRFIGRAAQVKTAAEAKAFLESVKAQEPGARHNVFAYVLRGVGDDEVFTAAPTAIERQSDDGEPQKTAGLPVLQVVRGAGLTNVMVVVTRYFGGTLLGTGGLVRAYTQAAQGALSQAKVVTMTECVDIQVVMPYSLYDTALYTLEHASAPSQVISTGFTDVVTLFFRMEAGTEESVLDDLEELLAGGGQIAQGDPHFCAF